jgi:hypothetical protein
MAETALGKIQEHFKLFGNFCTETVMTQAKFEIHAVVTVPCSLVETPLL